MQQVTFAMDWATLGCSAMNKIYKATPLRKACVHSPKFVRKMRINLIVKLRKMCYTNIGPHAMYRAKGWRFA